MTKVIFSIVICTYNRYKLLDKCLHSLATYLQKDTRIIIIDNASKDKTKNLIDQYKGIFSNLIYIYEPKQGLSYARNRGILEANTDWVVFIDDDILVTESYWKYLKESLNSKFDCIGGPYMAFSEDQIPHWVPLEFESYQPHSGQLQNCPYTSPHGGNVIYKTNILKELGGFNLQLGMKAESLGYGEETELQFRMEKAGCTFGFHPQMLVYHYVRPEKLSIKWMLQSKIINGRDSIGKYTTLTYTQLFWKTAKSLLSMIFIRFPINLLKLITKTNYFWQNLILESIGYLAILIGYWKGKLRLDSSKIYFW